MNFNYSYKAFLITALLVGNLYLLLYSVELTKVNPIEEQSYEIDYAIEEPILEEEIKETASAQKIETHRAYNEAENFIKKIEQEREESSLDTESKLAEMDKAMEDENLYKTSFTKPTSTTFKNETKPINGANKNTTNSYNLTNRDVLYFPNPVYVCDGYGKVVLFIVVSDLGKVTDVSLNKNSTTTSNLCLIETAIKYAKKARFNGDKNKPLQKGSITYIFPGQK